MCTSFFALLPLSNPKLKHHDAFFRKYPKLSAWLKSSKVPGFFPTIIAFKKIFQDYSSVWRYLSYEYRINLVPRISWSLNYRKTWVIHNTWQLAMQMSCYSVVINWRCRSIHLIAFWIVNNIKLNEENTAHCVVCSDYSLFLFSPSRLKCRCFFTTANSDTDIYSLCKVYLNSAWRHFLKAVWSLHQLAIKEICFRIRRAIKDFLHRFVRRKSFAFHLMCAVSGKKCWVREVISFSSQSSNPFKCEASFGQIFPIFSDAIFSSGLNWNKNAMKFRVFQRSKFVHN